MASSISIMDINIKVHLRIISFKVRVSYFFQIKILYKVNGVQGNYKEMH
jgi:hypothetical protein